MWPIDRKSLLDFASHLVPYWTLHKLAPNVGRKGCFPYQFCSQSQFCVIEISPFKATFHKVFWCLFWMYLNSNGGNRDCNLVADWSTLFDSGWPKCINTMESLKESWKEATSKCVGNTMFRRVSDIVQQFE